MNNSKEMIKCKCCNKYLGYPPLNGTGEYVCGRCATKHPEEVTLGTSVVDICAVCGRSYFWNQLSVYSKENKTYVCKFCKAKMIDD